MTAADIPEVFGGKQVAIMGASPGAFGTLLSQNAWLPVLRMLGMELWTTGRMLVPRAHTVLDEAGVLTDAGIAERLQAFVAGFVGFVDSHRS